MEPTELLKTVATLAKQGMTQKQIAQELGFSTTFTLNNRLVKASQQSGKPVPAFRKSRKDKVEKRVEVVKVRRRGKGNAFGVNVPQEPLVRAGVEPGTKLNVKVLKGRIILMVQT